MDKATKDRLVKRINTVLADKNERLEIHRTLGPQIFRMWADGSKRDPFFIEVSNIEALAKKLSVLDAPPSGRRTATRKAYFEAAAGN